MMKPNFDKMVSGSYHIEKDQCAKNCTNMIKPNFDKMARFLPYWKGSITRKNLSKQQKQQQLSQFQPSVDSLSRV